MLNTRIIMVGSSLCLAIAGIACLFIPAEAMSVLDMTGNDKILVQIPGALYLGFAALNWLARGSMIGGIYARPVCVANFFHWVIGASLLAREITSGYLNITYVSATLVYLVFAILFALMLFGRLESKPASGLT
jgi:hypothetical protein